MDLLINKFKIDPNNWHTDGYMPIHRACWGNEKRHTKTLKVLLDYGVDVE
jgi:hypothetical protein